MLMFIVFSASRKKLLLIRLLCKMSHNKFAPVFSVVQFFITFVKKMATLTLKCVRYAILAVANVYPK
jgi:hypothetical protein